MTTLSAMRNNVKLRASFLCGKKDQPSQICCTLKFLSQIQFMTAASQLNRTLTLRLAIIVVISNIIGSGVYKKVAPMMNELHSPGWVLLCWLFGGIITLFGALSNAEVASLLADTGGEYTYYKKIYGKFFSFLYGWSNFAAIKTAAVASVAYVFAESLHSIVHFPPILEHWEHVNILGIFHP